MPHNLDNTIALLSRTPSTMNALLRDLPKEWTHRNEGVGTFNAFDVIGHLIHGDRTDWIPRARIILEYGDTKPFEKFDRLAQTRESQGKSLPQLLDEFARVRAEKLAELRALKLKPQDFERREAASCPWHGYFVTVACDLGGARSHSFTSSLEGYGLPISRGRGPVDQVSRRDAL